MDRDGSGAASPLYRRLAAAIAEEIKGENWPAHTKLPSELSLAARYGVSRGTITKALDSLVLRGLLYRHKPRGTFVAPPSSPRSSPFVSTPTWSGHADVIAVVVAALTDEMMDSVHGSIIMGVQTVARSAGFGIMLALAENDVAMERYYIEDMWARGVGGMILFPGSHPVQYRNDTLLSSADDVRIATLQGMQEQEKPFVLVDRYVPAVHCDWVVSDDEAGGRTATEHLITLGHRRIGFLATVPNATSIAHRFSGYLSALQRHDLQADDRFIAGLREVTPEAHLRESREDTARLRAYLGSPDRPTAVVTTNDYVALRLIFAAESAGLHVPHDLAVASCGWGGTMGAHARVPLTSVVQPLLEIGRQATHVLLDRMAGRTSKTRQITLPVSLIVRESCGAGQRAFALAARRAP